MTALVRLAGKQIILRDWEEADLPVWVDWHRGKPKWRETDGPYLADIPIEEIEGEAEMRRTMIRAGMFEEPRRSLAIALQDSNQMIGTVSWYWRSKETLWLAAGISIYDPEYWGRGMGKEAFEMWTDYLFSAFPQIVRLGLETWSGNEGMMKLAEKLGYQLEARHRKARIVKGEYYDAIAYGILREEWENRPKD